MRERRMKKGLVRRVEEILKETRSKARIGKRVEENFWTAKGVPIEPVTIQYIVGRHGGGNGKSEIGRGEIRVGKDIYTGIRR